MLGLKLNHVSKRGHWYIHPPHISLKALESDQHSILCNAWNWRTNRNRTKSKKYLFTEILPLDGNTSHTSERKSFVGWENCHVPKPFQWCHMSAMVYQIADNSTVSRHLKADNNEHIKVPHYYKKPMMWKSIPRCHIYWTVSVTSKLELNDLNREH